MSIFDLRCGAASESGYAIYELDSILTSQVVSWYCNFTNVCIYIILFVHQLHFTFYFYIFSITLFLLIFALVYVCNFTFIVLTSYFIYCNCNSLIVYNYIELNWIMAFRKYCYFCKEYIFIWNNLAVYWSRNSWVRAISRIFIQFLLFFFFAMPYFERLGQCLKMRKVDNLHEWVAFVTVAQSSAVSCLVGSKPSLIKHLKALNQLVWRLPLRWKNALDWKICSISIISEIFCPYKHVLAGLFRK